MSTTQANVELGLPPLRADDDNDLHLLTDDQLNAVSAGELSVNLCVGECKNQPVGLIAYTMVTQLLNQLTETTCHK
jgi:hypothetical protein